MTKKNTDPLSALRKEVERLRATTSPEFGRQLADAAFAKIADPLVRSARRKELLQDAIPHLLAQLLKEHRLLRVEIERQARVTRQHEEELVRLRSGGPGRPSAMHLVKAEFQRLVEAGLIEATLTAEAHRLLKWLQKKHPDASCPTEKTIMNRLRSEYRQAKSASKRQSKQRKP